jgi:hypothetical protein
MQATSSMPANEDTLKQFKHSEKQRAKMRQEKSEQRTKKKLEKTIEKLIKLLYKQGGELQSYLIAFKFIGSGILTRASSNMFPFVHGTDGLSQVFEDACRLGGSDRQVLYQTPMDAFKLLNNAEMQWLATSLGHNRRLKANRDATAYEEDTDGVDHDEQSHDFQSRKDQTTQDPQASDEDKEDGSARPFTTTADDSDSAEHDEEFKEFSTRYHDLDIATARTILCKPASRLNQFELRVAVMQALEHLHPGKLDLLNVHACASTHTYTEIHTYKHIHIHTNKYTHTRKQ